MGSQRSKEIQLFQWHTIELFSEKLKLLCLSFSGTPNGLIFTFLFTDSSMLFMVSIYHYRGGMRRFILRSASMNSKAMKDCHVTQCFTFKNNPTFSTFLNCWIIFDQDTPGGVRKFSKLCIVCKSTHSSIWLYHIWNMIGMTFQTTSWLFTHPSVICPE